MKMIITEDIARVAHEVNRAYCEAIGDTSQPAWKDAPEWQRESALQGVRAHLDRALTPEESHALWFNDKFLQGWKWGPEKDVDKKEHPCMVPYGHLPEAQKVKDYLFAAVVQSLS